MNLTPQALDRWTKPGEPDLIVVTVSNGMVVLNRGKVPTIEQYNSLARASLDNGAVLHRGGETFSKADNMKTATPPSPGLSGSHNTHARLSPSHSKTWATCTAALAFLEANIHRVPEDTGSVYADAGTEAHDWAAKVMLKQCTIDEVPEDFREPVGAYIDHCLALVPEGVSYQVEVSVALFYQHDQKGTCDFAIVTDERVTIRDYKHGMGVLVLADENAQLAIYALSFIRELEAVYDFNPETIIDIAPFQPRHREANDVAPWVLTLGELEAFCDGITSRAAEANAAVNSVRENLACGTRDFSAEEVLAAAPGAEFVPQDGDHGSCRWCRCKGICEIRLAAATEGMDLPNVNGADMIALLPDLTKAEAKEAVEVRVEVVADALAAPTIITDEYLVNVYARGKAIRRFLDDVEEMLEARALAGSPVPGTKLVAGRQGNRAWANEEAADTFLRGKGCKEADRYNFKLKSPTEMEKVLDIPNTPKRTQSRWAELVSRSPGKPVLALADDKREAINAPVDMLPDLSGDEDDSV